MGSDLPDTDDPHALLGIGADANPEEVRRAYLGKIKIHPPDRDPDAFRRLRRAYESIVVRLHGESPPTRSAGNPSGWGLDADPDQTQSERVQALRGQIEAAVAEQRYDEVARLLLTPEAHPLTVDPAVTPLVLDVCHATAWTAPTQSAAVMRRYAELVTAAARPGSGHDNHPLWDLRALRHERAAWTQAAAAMPEFTAFLERAPVMRGPANRAVGEALAERIAEDPLRVLNMLDGAVLSASGMVALLTERATTWADANGADTTVASDDASPTALALARQLESGLSDTGRLSMEWVKRLAITLSGPAVVVAVGASLPSLLFSLFVGTLAYHFGFDATRSLYAKVVRPTVVPWLVATGQPLAVVAGQLRRQLAARGPWFRAMRPDAPHRYPTLLERDAALQALAALARLSRAGRRLA